MNINTRLSKLERIAGARPRDCIACGYPSRGVVRVVETEDDGPMPRCQNCGVPLDFDGKPLGFTFKRIIRTPKELS